jgi:drug/metabolite transporter (DMT)-like permease
VTRLSPESLPRYWAHFLAFSLVADVVPTLCLYRGMRRVPASTAGIILLLEPVFAAVLGSVVFVQPVTVGLVGGGALVLLSNYLSIREDRP